MEQQLKPAAQARYWERGLFVFLMAFFVYSSFGQPDWVGAPIPEPANEASAESPIGIYSREEIDYFLDIGLGSEYGNARATLRKWAADLAISTLGTPTVSDLNALSQIIEEINALQSSVALRLATDQEEPNVEIVFAPQREFYQHEPNYVPPNRSYFWVRWNGAGEIRYSRILLDTALDSEERAALLREEMAQSLGLLNTSNTFPESIFNDHLEGSPRTFAHLDRRLIEMLYRPEIRVGMRREEVEQLLGRLGPGPVSP